MKKQLSQPETNLTQLVERGYAIHQQLNLLNEEFKQIKDKHPGRVLIASSTKSELSYAGKPHSAFTVALLQSFCGKGISQEDGYVRSSDLAMYAGKTVPKLTNDKQHPVFDFKQADNFVVSYYAGGGVKPKGLPAEIEKPEIETEPGSGIMQVGFYQPSWKVENVVNASGDVYMNFGKRKKKRE